MKRLYLLFLFVFLATASFAQFVGASSVGSSSLSSPRESRSLFLKPHSDSYNSGLLLKADLGWEYYHAWLDYGLDLGYRFNSYFYAGIGAHVEQELYFPMELRVYLPLQNVSFFIGGFWGHTLHFDLDHPMLGGRVGVNRRFWTLSVSVYEMPYYDYFYHYYGMASSDKYIRSTINLEYSLPLRAIKQRLYK